MKTETKNGGFAVTSSEGGWFVRQDDLAKMNVCRRCKITSCHVVENDHGKMTGRRAPLRRDLPCLATEESAKK